MTPEQLVFLLIFLLIPLLNFLVRILRGRVRRAPRGPVEPAPGRPPAAAPSLRPRPAAPARPHEQPREPVRLMPVPETPGPQRVRARLDPADLRRGVVLMTILGACPGTEPPARQR